MQKQCCDTLLRTNIDACTLAGYETLSTTGSLLLEVGQGGGLCGNCGQPLGLWAGGFMTPHEAEIPVEV